METRVLFVTRRQLVGRWQCLCLRSTDHPILNSARAMTTISNKNLSLDNMNQNLKMIDHFIRGPLIIRAGEIEKELAKGVIKPFTEVVKAHIGDCHAMGQQPITFVRQVLALVIMPRLLKDDYFPEDVKKRARDILSACRGGSVGSYTEAVGLDLVRRHVAEFIERRDGIPSNPENIIISAGASDAIKPIDGKRPGVLAPIPQYPFYNAALAEFNMHKIGYYLDEAAGWGFSIEELERVIEDAKKVSAPRAIVVINPGNPTGQVLTRDNIEDIIKFAHKEKLFLLADEVYQQNVYAKGAKFHSFKKVLTEMGSPYSEVQLASFMSSSKGYMGECGLRGGYGEIINLCPQVKAMLFKACSAMLCPTVLGQAAVDCVVNPPEPGEHSYEQFKSERDGVLNELSKRARLMADSLNNIPGVRTNEVQGAMYAFPRIDIPPKAIAEAIRLNLAPDDFYALQLLKEAGICVVPGYAFGQREDTYHFRATTLLHTDKLKKMLESFKEFHLNFIIKYST